VDKEPTPTPLSSFVVLGVVVVLVVAFLVVVWRGLAALDSTVAAAVIAASATVLISVVSLIYSKTWEQRRAIEEAQREHKRGVYEEFIQFLFRTITEPPGEEAIQQFATELRLASRNSFA
jgi:choline-glycine betaine transporter